MYGICFVQGSGFKSPPGRSNFFALSKLGKNNEDKKSENTGKKNASTNLQKWFYSKVCKHSDNICTVHCTMSVIALAICSVKQKHVESILIENQPNV